jgi:hypothetical protein
MISQSYYDDYIAFNLRAMIEHNHHGIEMWPGCQINSSLCMHCMWSKVLVLGLVQETLSKTNSNWIQDQNLGFAWIPNPSSDPSSHFAAKIWTSVVRVYIFFVYPKVRVYIKLSIYLPNGLLWIFFHSLG